MLNYLAVLAFGAVGLADPILKPVWEVKALSSVKAMVFDSRRDLMIAATPNNSIFAFNAKSANQVRLGPIGALTTDGYPVNSDNVILGQGTMPPIALDGQSYLRSIYSQTGPNIRVISSSSEPTIVTIDNGSYMLWTANRGTQYLPPNSLVRPVDLGDMVVVMKPGINGPYFSIVDGQQGAVQAGFQLPAGKGVSMEVTPDGDLVALSDRADSGYVVGNPRLIRTAPLQGKTVNVLYSQNYRWALNGGWEFAATKRGRSPNLVRVADGKTWQLKPKDIKGRKIADASANVAAFALADNLVVTYDGAFFRAYKLPQ